MPSAAPPISLDVASTLQRLGVQLRAVRRRQRITAVAAAEAAGLSRVTWHRIEKGEPSVAVGSWVAAAQALGLQPRLGDLAAAAAPAQELPDVIALADHPQLARLAWQQPGVTHLSPQEAFSLYERNWRHVDAAGLTPAERALVMALSARLGGGRLLV